MVFRLCNYSASARVEPARWSDEINAPLAYVRRHNHSQSRCDGIFLYYFYVAICSNDISWPFIINLFLFMVFPSLIPQDARGHNQGDTGFFKKNNHPHIHGHMELFAPPCPQFNVGHSGCTRRPSKKTTILVTRAFHYNLLQHWVGGAGGAAIALLDVDVVVFFEEPGEQENACAASVCLRGFEVILEWVSVAR